MKADNKRYFEEVYEEKGLFGFTKYFTNFKFINNKGEFEFGILRIDKLTYLTKVLKKNENEKAN